MKSAFPHQLAQSKEGFSLLELMVAAIVIGVVSLFLINRLNYYQEAAEKADMEYTVQALKSVLRMQMATLLVEGKIHRYTELISDNPMEWLDTRPSNYLGALQSPTIDQLAGRSWYFDMRTHTLNYLPGLSAHLQTNGIGRKQIRFKVLFVQGSKKQNEAKSADEVAIGVRLERVESYRWF